MSIQEQIEALTQELRPYPRNGKKFWYFNPLTGVESATWNSLDYDIEAWEESLLASTNKAEVEEYADCYRRLKLYQLIGKKVEKEFPLLNGVFVGTDFFDPKNLEYNRTNGCITNVSGSKRRIALAGVWFLREEDRLEALKICGITKELQERCSKYGLGGT